MTIDTAVLGYLSWRPMTGYDLKKLFADNPLFHWSGNSNQIYRTLVRLHKEEWVSLRTEHQESLPPRKVYSITTAGRTALRQQLVEQPEAPAVRHPFLVQLAWADELTTEDLDSLLDRYRLEVEMALAMLEAKVDAGLDKPDRTDRERALWHLVEQRAIEAYQTELRWTDLVRQQMNQLGST